MLCAISGEAPQEPVASKKSGTVFEKRLIESYIAEHRSDPVTGEELSLEDLVPLRSPSIVKPRPPTLTSIPSLLSVFQNEWDAVALETFQLKQQLTQLRQELSTALYNHDAAVRVIARLTQERDDARDALGRLSMGERATNGDAMQVDGQAAPQTLPDAVLAKIESTQEQLSKTRRKRPVPDEWAATEDLQSYKVAATYDKLPPNSQTIAIASNNDTILLGGEDGSAYVGLLSKGLKRATTIRKASKNGVTDGLFRETDGPASPIIADAMGEVIIYEGNTVAHSFRDHAGPVVALSLHPSGDVLASVGADRTFVLYDLQTKSRLTQIEIGDIPRCCQFHPDGHLLGIGTAGGEVKVFDVKSLSSAASFSVSGPVQDISFSENGTWLAAAVKGSSNVSILDLRKSSELKSLDFGGEVASIAFDYTGRYLAGTGSSGTGIQAYDKGAKAWTEPFRSSTAGVRLVWGESAKSLVLLGPDGKVNVLE